MCHIYVKFSVFAPPWLTFSLIWMFLRFICVRAHTSIFLVSFCLSFWNPAKLWCYSYFFINYVSITKTCCRCYPISVYIIMRYQFLFYRLSILYLKYLVSKVFQIWYFFRLWNIVYAWWDISGVRPMYKHIICDLWILHINSLRAICNNTFSVPVFWLKSFAQGQVWNFPFGEHVCLHCWAFVFWAPQSSFFGLFSLYKSWYSCSIDWESEAWRRIIFHF